MLEQLAAEDVTDIAVETSDTSHEQQVSVDYGRSSVEGRTESRAATVLEELAVERFDEVDRVVEEKTREHHVQVHNCTLPNISSTCP